MGFRTSHRARRGSGGTLRCVIALFLLAAGPFATPIAVNAQSVRLSAEQQRMLNQLPPAQREQALRALEQYESSRPQSVTNPITETPSTPPPAVSSVPVIDEEEELRASPNSSLVIRMSPKADLTVEELEALDENPVKAALVGNRSYTLDDVGVLSLFDVRFIPLLGLTEADIEMRLEAEPLLANFDIDVRILSVAESGVDALEYFGYELFEPHEVSFDPPMSGPVPPDYVLGSGDTVRVQLYGKQNEVFELDVTRDGQLNLPDVGPFVAAGLPFSEVREEIKRRVGQMLLGTEVSVTMGQLRNIRVFVVGDANRPGSYVVSSLATMSSALYRSGGISRVGSLRNIELKRDGKTVATLDLYDLLLRGDSSGDQRLMPGDSVFVNPVGPRIGIGGAVKRPAIYELRGTESVAEALNLAGGLTDDAYSDGARIERISEQQRRVVVSIDADGDEAKTSRVRPGDVVVVPKVLPEMDNVITLVGQVERPGPHEWRPGFKLTDLINSRRDLKSAADVGYVLIRREDQETREISALSADLGRALDDPRSQANVPLQPRDTVYVFDQQFGRQLIIDPILDELTAQSRYGKPLMEASVTGRVKAPGAYPLESGMRVSDLIRAGGSLSEDAFSLSAEIARYQVVEDSYRETEIINVDLAAVMAGDAAADIEIREYDNLRISRLPKWAETWSVTLEGEVTYPGVYRIRNGETLRQIIERAGGLTEDAFPAGAIFLREHLREREQEQIEVLAQRMEADLTALSLENRSTDSSDTMATGQNLLAQLRSTRAVGRLVIDLDPEQMPDDNGRDVELRDGDRLLVPRSPDEVTVIGETQQNSSHLYQVGLSRDDYIGLSGGLTRRADKKLIYVVRASGAVARGNRSRWIGRSSGLDIRPGDTIVVPADIDRIRPLTLWTNVSQILYQAAIAVAAVRTFDN